MKMKAIEADGQAIIHNVRFYNLAPRSIMCMAYNKLHSKLAVSRSDASIEIWDLTHAPYLEKTLPNSAASSVEGLGWCGDRLFSAGLTGELNEWDLATLKCKRSQHVTGSAIWCLDVHEERNLIATGTEEGYLNLFDLENGELNYKSLFDKQEGRILCCKFSETGAIIVTGSIDVIRIWNAKTGHAIHKMTVGRNEAKKETIVWSLQVLRDFTIISGDSRGQVTVWDGKIGAQIESHQVLQADVLTVAVNENEDMLICSGIDPIIRIYALTSIKKEDSTVKKWVKFLQRSVHDHDVKSIICAGEKILSGGLDGYLGISSLTKSRQSICKYGPFLQGPIASISSEQRSILLRYSNYLEIWRLGSTKGTIQLVDDDESKSNGKLLSVEQGPEKLLEMKSKNEEFVVASALSPDGCWLAYSTADEIRLFSFVAPSGETPKLNRVKVLPEEFTAAIHIVFSQDSKQLFLVKANNQIDVFNILSNGDIDHQQTVETSKYIKDTIHLITVSKCRKYLIAAGLCRTISVWQLVKKAFTHYLNLPRYIAATTAIAIHDNAPRLVAAFADKKIFEYDFDEMCFTCSDKDLFVTNLGSHCVNNIVLDPRNPDVIILHNDTNLFVLQKKHKKVGDEVSSTKKSKDTTVNSNVATLKLKFHKTYEHFVHLDWLADTELVVVGVNPVSLIEQLPSAMRQKKFAAA